MNCQELARLLEEQDLDQLPAAQRSLVEADLAECPESIRNVQLHECLAALPVPPFRCERITEWREVALREAVGRTQRRRLRARLYVLGSLVTAAALTALVVMHLMQVQEQPIRRDIHHGPEQPELPPTRPEFHQP